MTIIIEYKYNNQNIEKLEEYLKIPKYQRIFEIPKLKIQRGL